MRPVYPLMLDLSQRTVVIVGGGAVAVRKAIGVLAGGAAVTRCVAPRIAANMPTQVERIAEPFRPEHLDGAHLVFAATDSAAVNDQVVREAHQRGLLVNRADVSDAEAGDFTVPAVWRGGAVTLAVSAGGSAALAAAMRDELARRIGQRHIRMAEAMQELRPRIVQAGLGPSERAEALRDLASPAAMDELEKGGPTVLKEWLVRRHPALAGKV